MMPGMRLSPSLQARLARLQRTLPAQLVQRFIEIDLLTQAASLSFFALLSLAPLLVPVEIREKFDLQKAAFDQAIFLKDVDAVRRTGAAMERAWLALDRIATPVARYEVLDRALMLAKRDALPASVRVSMSFMDYLLTPQPAFTEEKVSKYACSPMHIGLTSAL